MWLRRQDTDTGELSADFYRWGPFLTCCRRNGERG